MYMYMYNVHVSIIGIFVEERRGRSKRWWSLRERERKYIYNIIPQAESMQSSPVCIACFAPISFATFHTLISANYHCSLYSNQQGGPPDWGGIYYDELFVAINSIICAVAGYPLL